MTVLSTRTLSVEETLLLKQFSPRKQEMLMNERANTECWRDQISTQGEIGRQHAGCRRRPQRVIRSRCGVSPCSPRDYLIR